MRCRCSLGFMSQLTVCTWWHLLPSSPQVGHTAVCRPLLELHESTSFTSLKASSPDHIIHKLVFDTWCVSILTQVLWCPAGVFDESVLQLGKMEVTDDYFRVLQAIEVHQVLQLPKKHISTSMLYVIFKLFYFHGFDLVTIRRWEFSFSIILWEFKYTVQIKINEMGCVHFKFGILLRLDWS